MWHSGIKFSLLRFSLPMVLYCLFAQQASSQVSEVGSNDLKPLGPFGYQIGPGDPYLVIRSTALPEADSASNKSLILPIKLTKNSAQSESLKLEVFFAGRAKDTSNKSLSHIAFDARKRIEIQVNRVLWSAADGIQINLPEGVKQELGAYIRVDFNDCTLCVIELQENNAIDQTVPANILSLRRGLRPIGDVPRDISVDQWQFNDIDKEGAITGVDPFAISPKLDASTEDLAGIYFELIGADPNAAFAKFQTFFSTESHGFVEGASQYSMQTNEQGDYFQLYLPLDFLKSQTPQARILEQVRLDLESGMTSIKINKAQLVPVSLDAQFKEFRPKLLSQSKHQKASKRLIIKNIFKRFSQDLVFMVCYILALFLLATYLWRQSRNT